MALPDEELEALLADLESDRLDRKAELGAKEAQRQLRKTLCAFANDLPNHRRPGVLFLGVSDDGTPSGLRIDDELLKTLANWPRDGSYSPMPDVVVHKRRLLGADLCVVEVQPHPAPPVRLNGQAWVRVGPTVRHATVAEELRLTERRRAADLPFDVRPVTAASLDDLDLDRFRTEYLPNAVAEEVLERNERTLLQQLAALRLVAPGPDAVPTALGLVVCGYEPTRFLPGAYVQFLRYDGTDQGDDVLDQKRLDGPLTDVVRRVEEVLEALVSAATDLSRATERRQYDFPPVALREVSRNAVLHRDYEGSHAPVFVRWFMDRVEITSPGGPYGSVTRDNFGQPEAVDYRNPNLAGAMRDLGLVQKFGWGLQRARRALADNGNPPLEPDPSETHVRVVVRPAR